MDHLQGSSKSTGIKKKLNEALEIMNAAGIPIDDLSLRRRERMAVCFMAVGGVTKIWNSAKSTSEGRHLKTREIIPIVNEHFE